MTDKKPLEGLITKEAPPGVPPEADAAAEGRIKGYGSLFNVVDGDGDIMVPGCFDKSLARHKSAGTAPAMLWRHEYWEMPVGVWKTATVDEKGLVLEGLLATGCEKGAELYALAKIGALTGLSIGFFVIKQELITDAATKTVLGRRILEADIYECSLCTFPVMGPARINEVKSGDLAPDPQPASPPGIDPGKQPRLLKALGRLTDLKPGAA